MAGLPLPHLSGEKQFLVPPDPWPALDQEPMRGLNTPTSGMSGPVSERDTELGSSASSPPITSHPPASPGKGREAGSVLRTLDWSPDGERASSPTGQRTGGDGAFDRKRGEFGLGAPSSSLLPPPHPAVLRLVTSLNYGPLESDRSPLGQGRSGYPSHTLRRGP